MGDGAECPGPRRRLPFGKGPPSGGGIPCGAELDKTHTKFSFLRVLPDGIRLRLYYAGQGRKSPCLNKSAPKPMAGAFGGRYGSCIIIAPEYKLEAGACRSRGARGA